MELREILNQTWNMITGYIDMVFVSQMINLQSEKSYYQSQ